PPRPGRRPRPPRGVPPPGRRAGEAQVLRRPHPARGGGGPVPPPADRRPAVGVRPGLAGRRPRPPLTPPPADPRESWRTPGPDGALERGRPRRPRMTDEEHLMTV